MLSAKEAKYLSRYGYSEDKHSELFKSIERDIERTAIDGYTDLQHFTDGRHLSESELKEICDLGYDICWNSACLWYEISWE